MWKILGDKKMSVPSPEDKNNSQENRKNYEQKITGLKDKIEKRRRNVYILDLQGYGNQEIADMLNVSISTIEKDLHFMKYYCLKWSGELIRMGRGIPFGDAFNQLDLVQKELWNMYRAEKSTSTKKRILDSIAANSVKKGNLFSGRPYGSYMDDLEMHKMEQEVENDISSEQSTF